MIQLKTYNGRYFELTAAEEWNKLDDRVREAKSLSLFRRSLKTTLFDQYYGRYKQENTVNYVGTLL